MRQEAVSAQKRRKMLLKRKTGLIPAVRSRYVQRAMVQVAATIHNEAGIHCRPTAVIIKEASGYSGSVTVESPGGRCRLGSALELMMLGLEKGTVVTIEVDGPDEQEAAHRFQALFETNFDFPDAGSGGMSG